MAYSPVRLIGSGRIAQADANFGFAANAIFYITDNVEVEVANSIPSAADRVLVLTENAKLTVGGSFHLGDRGSLTISNGTFKVGSFYAPSSEPCTFRVAGGEVNLGDNKFARFTDDSTIEFTGGNITQETGRLSEPRLFPPRRLDYSLRRDVAPEVYHLEAVVLKECAADVLADVVDVALYRRDDDRAPHARAVALG